MSGIEIVKEISDYGVVAVARTKHPDKLLRIAEAICQVGASFLKQTIPWDLNLVAIEEIQKLIAGEPFGRVDR